MKILVGCDPELFVKKDGVLVSAHGLVQGSKEHPFRVSKGAVQVDGMALEFNIDPAEDENQFYLTIVDVMQALKAMCPEHEFAIQPVAEFGAEYIKAQPEEAKELGCEPDYDAWTGRVNEKPNMDAPFRTASGHVHIGWRDPAGISLDHVDNCRAAAKQMDFFLGLPSLFFDEDTKRRELYGNPGCFRPKPYGAEYRTLSNAWLRDPSLIRWVFRQVQEGMHRLIAGDCLDKQFGDITKIIKTSDKKAALQIINQAGIKLAA